MHGKTNSQENNKRKHIDSETEDTVEIMCNDCGNKYTEKETFMIHKKNCTIVQTKHVTKELSRPCFNCDLIVTANSEKELVLEMIKHTKVCNMKEDVRKYQFQSENVPSPPRKKIKDKDINETCDIDEVMNGFKEMEVDEKEDTKIIKEEEKIPPRLEGMLKIKVISIKEHKLKRVGGGGRCGANCISVQTTGSEYLAEDIAKNKNKHIVDNWENIYRESFQFPYTERVRNGTRTFHNETEFIRFLETEEDEASYMWMTHTCMQAVSTMLNVNISILTTGIQPSRSHLCIRCKPKAEFKTEAELRNHIEKVHHRM